MAVFMRNDGGAVVRILSARDGDGRMAGIVVAEIFGLSWDALSKSCKSLRMRLPMSAEPLGPVQATMKNVTIGPSSPVAGKRTS